MTAKDFLDNLLLKFRVHSPSPFLGEGSGLPAGRQGDEGQGNYLILKVIE